MGERSRCGVLFPMIVLIVLLGLSGGLGFGQAASNAPQSNATANGAQQATPTFRSSSRLVLVDVVVTDKAGQTVKGLKATDFTILEDGKPQPIRAFESHVWQKTAPSMQKINLPPNQYTNFTEQQPNSAVNVVLLDILNTPQQDQQYARKQMIEFLRELPPGQRIALFVLGTKLRMMQGFTGRFGPAGEGGGGDSFEHIAGADDGERVSGRGQVISLTSQIWPARAVAR